MLLLNRSDEFEFCLKPIAKHLLLLLSIEEHSTIRGQLKRIKVVLAGIGIIVRGS
jgi:hypothetical protein